MRKEELKRARWQRVTYKRADFYDLRNGHAIYRPDGSYVGQSYAQADGQCIINEINALHDRSEHAKGYSNPWSR